MNNRDIFHNDFFNKLEDRNRQIADRITSVYRQENPDIAFIVGTMNYWLDGENPGLIPDDYFVDPAVMTQFQADRMKKHIEEFDDDFIPFLFPWYGTGVVPSALGCEIIFHPKQDPSVGCAIIQEPDEIKKLQKPDPYKDGLMPRVLDTIDFMKRNTDLPVSVTDPQGPLNIAISICGVENFFIWMLTDPDRAHAIMDFCSDVLIDWIKVQKDHAGQKLDSGAWPHGILLPEGFGGVWLADDDCTQVSEGLYKEFVVPYNAKVFKAFAGGTIHFCGSASHQIDNFMATEGITGVNNFCMGDFEQVYKMQEKFEDRIALMVCDFAPFKIDEYFTGLFSGLKAKGTILATYLAAGYALKDGRYELTQRDTDKISHQLYRTIKQGIRG